MSSSAVDLNQRTRTLPLWQLMVLVTLVLAFFAHTYWLSTTQENRAAHITETDRINVKAVQLSQYAKQASSGDVEAFNELITDRTIIENTVNSLRNGNDEYPSLPTVVRPRFDAMADKWQVMNANVLTIIDQRERIEELNKISDKFASEIPILQASSDAVVKRLVAINGDRNLIYLASQQLVLADRMLRRMSEILRGGAASIQAADSLDRDARMFQEVMTGMFNGNDRIKAVTDHGVIRSTNSSSGH